MEILIKRYILAETYTIGRLTIGNLFSCDTLEDKVRIPFVKVPKETAIPAGSYKVVMDLSPTFKVVMPHVLNVPNFEGIRIHPGNDEKNTEGCILVGLLSAQRDKLISSRPTYEKLIKIIENDKNLTLRII